MASGPVEAPPLAGPAGASPKGRGERAVRRVPARRGAGRAALLLGWLGLATPIVAAPGAAAGECVVLEDFSRGQAGEFPPDWKPRKEAGREVYSIREEGGLRFLRAASRGLGVQAAKEHPWDLTTRPVLAWSWRPLEFPQGSDERHAKTNDSALAVYAVFPYSAFAVKAVKYIWSATVPAGSHLNSSRGLTQVRVLRSGVADKGEWIEERVNVLDDYRTLFGESEAPKPLGIAVLTDADDTRSRAQGDYARFRLCPP